MTRRISVCALSFSLICFVGTCSSQVATGTPPFGSFGGGPFDTINLGNLNVNFSIPVFHKAGRGIPFTYDLNYDSSVWYPVNSSGGTTWTPVANWGWRGITEAATGYVTYRTYSNYCFIDTIKVMGTYYDTWRYHDPSGTSHPFTISFNSCNGGPIVATATDGSGYTMSADVGYAEVYPPSGGKIVPPRQAQLVTAP